jgi:hypothetical protein
VRRRLPLLWRASECGESLGNGAAEPALQDGKDFSGSWESSEMVSSESFPGLPRTSVSIWSSEAPIISLRQRLHLPWLASNGGENFVYGASGSGLHDGYDFSCSCETFVF